MGRPLSPPQMHQKIIWMLSNFQKATSEHWQRTPGTQKGSPISLKESEIEVARSCPTLCDPVDYSLPGFSVHGILQARILECVTIFFSRGSSQSKNQTHLSYFSGGFFISEPAGKRQNLYIHLPYGPAISVLGICPREMKVDIQTKTLT